LYQKGDQVWLEASHIKTRHQKTKLAPKRYGPFRIRKKISPVAYQLTLPMSWGIHDVFHASFLYPYHETKEKGPNFTRPPLELIEGEEEYEVKAIRNHQRQGRSKQLHYLIKWKGYPESDSTWEPANQVHAPDLIKLYHGESPSRIKKTQTMPLEVCPSLESSPPNHSSTPIFEASKPDPPLENCPPTNIKRISSSNLSSPSANFGSFGPTISPPRMPWNIPGFASTHTAPTTTPMEIKSQLCQTCRSPLLSTTLQYPSPSLPDPQKTSSPSPLTTPNPSCRWPKGSSKPSRTERTSTNRNYNNFSIEARCETSD
jgi:Chromo (CHRromatin Organisation MOdifier) domain